MLLNGLVLCRLSFTVELKMGVTEYDWDSYNGYYSVSFNSLSSLLVSLCIHD